MPTPREYEEAAVDYCLDNNGMGVWVMHLEQVHDTAYDVAVRLGGHYRGETKGVALIRVIYYPQQQQFICLPTEALFPELAVVDDSAYLVN